MIRTGLMDVTQLTDEKVYEKHYLEVPLFRKEKADKIWFMQGKALSVGVWVLFQKMKEEYKLSEQAAYNFSHSGKYALCSIADSESLGIKLGCDVEMIGAPRTGLAERFFCHAEQALILSKKTEEERAEAFYRMWVLKESFIKATGYGMKMDLKSFEIEYKQNQPYLIRQPIEIKETYNYKEYNSDIEDAKIAVCANTTSFDEELHMYKVGE